MNELLDLMRGRRSVRTFKATPVPEPTVRTLLDAAVTAPSASNKQPWRFYVVTDPARIEAVADGVRQAVERVAEHVDERFEGPFRAYGDYFVRFETAPVVIAAIWRPVGVLSHMVGAELDETDRASIDELEATSGLLSLGLALQNLLLAAHAEGLGASVMTGPLVALPAIREVLGLKPSWRLAALLPLGYPDETPAPPGRKSSDKVTKWFREQGSAETHDNASPSADT